MKRTFHDFLNSSFQISKKEIEFQSKENMLLSCDKNNIIKHEEEEEEVCAITLEKLSSLKKVTRLKCGHQFCTHSLNLSLQISPLCPLCRTRILEIPVRIAQVQIYDIHDFPTSEENNENQDHENESEDSFSGDSFDSIDYTDDEDEEQEYFDEDEM